MNRRFVFTAAAVLALFMCVSAWADVPIDSENFPDENFRNYVLELADGNSTLTTEQAEIALPSEITEGAFLFEPNASIMKAGVQNALIAWIYVVKWLIL